MSSGLVPLMICPQKQPHVEVASRGLRPLDPRGKEVKIQGVSVRPTRKPKASPRATEVLLSRMAERRKSGSLSQDPPRTTRVLQLPPAVHAEPSAGGFPAYLSCQQSSTPSPTLPLLSCRPDRFAANEPTRAVRLPSHWLPQGLQLALPSPISSPQK